VSLSGSERITAIRGEEAFIGEKGAKPEASKASTGSLEPMTTGVEWVLVHGR
jgi:hypothetical protein